MPLFDMLHTYYLVLMYYLLFVEYYSEWTTSFTYFYFNVQVYPKIIDYIPSIDVVLHFLTKYQHPTIYK